MGEADDAIDPTHISVECTTPKLGSACEGGHPLPDISGSPAESDAALGAHGSPAESVQQHSDKQCRKHARKASKKRRRAGSPAPDIVNPKNGLLCCIIMRS